MMQESDIQEVRDKGASLHDVVVVGAGLAGLAAACALADAGQRVLLLERRPYVGGRASSYEHPGTGEVVDNCQHILLGCCTNLIEFYRRLNVAECIRWFDALTFIEPGGRRSRIVSTSLPAPFHTSFSFLGARALSVSDKFAIGRAMLPFLRGIPADTQENFAHWLQRHGQTSGAIERFWKPVIVSALNDDLDRISVHYAGKVIRDSFLGSVQAGYMGIPTIPLSELYGHAVNYICARGGEVLLRANVEAMTYDAAAQCWNIQTPGREFSSSAVVLALPFEAMQTLLPKISPAADSDLANRLPYFDHSPITGIHLWFDQKITELEHAVLLDRTIQWMYHKSLLQPQTRANSSGDYLELVVSASKSLVPLQRQEIIDLALQELAEFFPCVRQAKLLKAAVVKEVRATFCVTPGLDACRPGPLTAWPGIFLAGDWTATGWPATMEGAVRSGYLAAESCMGAKGSTVKMLQPDLPLQGLMRLFK